MDIAAVLRDAGLTVIEGRPFGRIDDVDGISVVLTGTSKDHEGASDINGVVADGHGTFYVERDGRVWMLARGPIAGQSGAVVFQAAYRDDSVTDEQHDATATLLDALSAVYDQSGGTVAAETEQPGDGESAPDPDEPEGETE